MKINITYFAILQDERGVSSEVLETPAQTPAEIYRLLKESYNFSLTQCRLKVAVNDDFADWDTLLKDGDNVVFIPPVAGG